MSTIMHRFFSWPSRPGNHLESWPVIARRLAFAPLVYAGLAMAFIGLAFGWGLYDAQRFWRDAT